MIPYEKRFFLARWVSNLGLFFAAVVELVRHLPLYLTIGGRNLVQAKRRALLLGGALALVTVLFIVFDGLVSGASQSMTHSVRTLISGDVNVAGFYKQTPDSFAAPIVLHAADIRKIATESTPGVDYILTRDRGFAQVFSDTTTSFTGLSGVDPKEETRLLKTLTLAPEKDYEKGGGDQRKGDLSKLGTPHTIVIFAGEAKRWGVEVGDVVTIVNPTLNGTQNSLDLTVVAICDDLGLLSQFSSFVSNQTISDLYQLKPDITGAVQIYLKNIDDSTQVMNHLRHVYAAKGYRLVDHESTPFWRKIQEQTQESWSGQKLDVTTWEDEASMFTSIIKGEHWFGGFLLAVLLAIIMVGIINAMWISVRERTGEIGTLRAIGMSRSRVLAMFIAEAGLLGLIAGGVGALVGTAISLAADAAHLHISVAALRMFLLSETYTLYITVPAVLGAVVGFTVITVVAALWPALRAANLQPVTAIQQVE